MPGPRKASIASMIIDSHSHILPPRFQELRAQLRAQDDTFAALFARENAAMATAETLIEAMDSAEVSRSVVMGMGWTDPLVAREANDYIIDALQRYPQRLTGFCSVNPAWGEAALEEVERCAAAGLAGIGELHPDTQGVDITDGDALTPLMDAARRLGLPVLVHSSEPVGHLYPGKGATTPDKLCRFIENFPENTIICAHWGGGLPFYALMPEVSDLLRNTYFDMAASPLLYRPEVVPAAAQLVGPEKVLFATDYPLIKHKRMLRQVTESSLEPAAKVAILGGNAARVLGLG